MRVITEERLQEIIMTLDEACREVLQPGVIADTTVEVCKNAIQHLIDNEIVEIDQHTVNKLRPMSDAYDYTTVLACFDHDPESLHEYYVVKNCKHAGVIGWTPMPLYKPEQP